ncbi:Brain protein I3 [Pteropus alecto]|uniref:Membrane protein BRI3 n=1 Tax=Pteropus alecto TaxID=9402 RepID=L5L1C3_PTEAL|nr:Brain protein I3 [Pteropus alecto]
MLAELANGRWPLRASRTFYQKKDASQIPSCTCRPSVRVYSIHSRNVTRYPANSIVVVGGCPVCRVGVLEDSFTFLGIFLAIILFPFGFICCFALRKRRCPNCGATFT